MRLKDIVLRKYVSYRGWLCASNMINNYLRGYGNGTIAGNLFNLVSLINDNKALRRYYRMNCNGMVSTRIAICGKYEEYKEKKLGGGHQVLYFS